MIGDGDASALGDGGEFGRFGRQSPRESVPLLGKAGNGCVCVCLYLRVPIFVLLKKSQMEKHHFEGPPRNGFLLVAKKTRMGSLLRFHKIHLTRTWCFRTTSAAKQTKKSVGQST